MLANPSFVAKNQLNAIVTRALIDDDFKAGILNGTRRQKLEEYPLPDTIQQAVLEIKADDLNHFIFKMHELLRL
ncbi:MAG: hypothetical protein ABFS17_04970 [Chloroflexota bacterium]